MTDQEYMWLTGLLDGNAEGVPAQALERLESRGWIKTFINGSFCDLTQRGKAALESEKRARNQLRQQKAENAARQKEEQARAAEQRRKDARHDYCVAILSGLIGSVATLVAEHFSAICRFIKQLLKL